MTSDSNDPPGLRPVKDAYKVLGLWSIRRALTVAFSGAAVLLVAAWFFVTWLLGSPARDQSKPLDVAAQLDLLKLVFASVAGIGALVALVTAYRRQRIDEAAGELAQRAQTHAEQISRAAAHDATERRVTDLYGQAVEQLGADKAAVRLGGLYSLERLAQDHPQHRQTVTDVVCAYLRMPFQPPDEQTLVSDSQQPTDGSAQQELQVRRAAQRLIHRHLTTTPAGQEHPPTYWANMRIDLTGAYLNYFDFTRCRPTHAVFTNAQFSGYAWFDEAQFSRDARFYGAQFSGYAGFDGAEFSGGAWFDRARFSGYAWFVDAQFGGYARFSNAQFGGYAWFVGAKFGGETGFDGAQFGKDTRFEQAQFDHEPDFANATTTHPNDEHVWPVGWHTEADSPDADTARLIRQE